jgi:hypothetical protein
MNLFTIKWDRVFRYAVVRGTPCMAPYLNKPLYISVNNHAMEVQNFNEIDTLILTFIVEAGAPDVFGNTMPVRGISGGVILGVG